VKAAVLVVDDDAHFGALIAEELGARGFEVVVRTSAAEALGYLASTHVDAVVTDVDMDRMNGLELCERIVASAPEVPVLILTALGNVDVAVGAIRAGAYDFITKPPDPDALAIAVERAVEHRRLNQEVTRLRRAVEEARGVGDMIGTSAVVDQLRDLIDRVVESEASVLITGESGTGKELVARALHRRGRRAQKPFVTINCAAVPANLLESELFGHVRGAFTDARTSRTGLFVQAHGGTLFLDEIGELPVELQPKLLRVLQERVVRPVGGTTEVECNLRLVAATNRDLEEAVAQARFREDLYFRLNVIHIEVPALRFRGNDVLLLAQHFVDRYAAASGRSVRGIAPAVAERLVGYQWPGNVRELQNCIERGVALARYDQIMVDDLPPKLRRFRQWQVSPRVEEGVSVPSLAEAERMHILRVLDLVKGSRRQAAMLLGIDRKTLYRKLREFGAIDAS
jgi:two-component system response regulator AtoC